MREETANSPALLAGVTKAWAEATRRARKKRTRAMVEILLDCWEIKICSIRSQEDRQAAALKGWITYVVHPATKRCPNGERVAPNIPCKTVAGNCRPLPIFQFNKKRHLGTSYTWLMIDSKFKFKILRLLQPLCSWLFFSWRQKEK